MATKKQEVDMLEVQDDLYHVYCGIKAFCHVLPSIYQNGLDEETGHGFDWLGEYVIDQVEAVCSKLEALAGSHQEFPALKKAV